MTSKSKQKGTRIENKIVKTHQDNDVPCKRVPLSGSVGGVLKGDIVVGQEQETLDEFENILFRGEVKSRKGGTGFTVLERWLGNNDFLFLHRNYQEPMVIMNMSTYLLLIKAFIKK